MISSFSLFFAPFTCTCVTSSRLFAKLPFTSIDSSSVKTFAFVIFLVRSATALLGELSLDCDALGFRSVEQDANGRGTMEFIGLGVAFARVPFAELAFTTLGGTFGELEALGAFAERTAVRGTIVVVLIRGVLTGVVVGFLVLKAATNNPGVRESVNSVALLPVGPFAGVCVVVVLLPGTFTALVVSTSLYSDGRISSY